METSISIADVVVGLIATLGVGLSGFVAWRQFRHQTTRDKWQDVQSNYEKRIDLAKKRGDSAKANAIRAEYDVQLEAWLAQQELEGLTPTTITLEPTSSLSQEEVDRLRELLETSRLLTPAALSAEDYFLRGNVLIETGQYEEALEAYDRALAVRPDYVEAHSNRGVALGRLGRYPEALAACDRALALRPDAPEAHYNRGVVLWRLDRYPEALEACDRALTLRPDDPEVHYNRGVVLGLLGRYPEALEAFDRALALRPDYPSAMFNKACAYSSIEDGEQALEWLAQAIEADEKYSEMAKTDDDCDFLRKHSHYGPRFRELVGEGDKEA